MLARLLLGVLAAMVLIWWLLLPSVGSHPGPRKQSVCFNNLKQISLALMNYDSRYGSLPPAYIADQNGKPMHSWRVLILPFLEQESLYKQYDFSEPWNGPHNSRLMEKCPTLFRCPSASNENRSATNYVAVVGDTTMWPNNRCVQFESIKDGAANTIMLVEVADSNINWMEPRDLSFDQATIGMNVDRRHGISSNHTGTINVAYADGHMTHLSDGVSSEALKALFTIAGGETIDEDQNGNPVIHQP
jgi:prepilin-type processing-associated H-X9-DG protein